MEHYFTSQWKNFKINWKSIINRFLIYLLGVYLFGMGIALYLNTRVGASQIDITNFAFIALIKGLNANGSISSLGIYPTVLLVFYLVMLVAVIGLRTTNAIINYRQFHNKEIFFTAAINSILDLIPTFVWTYFINLNLLYIPADEINKIQSLLWRTIIFICGFMLYCIGISLTVYAQMLFGPYNGLSQELHILTKWNYKLCRVLMDIALMIIGVIIMIATPIFSWNTKEEWFNQYFGFGTIFFAFIAGPIIGSMLNWNKKILAKI